MTTATIELLDEVNVKIHNLTTITRRKIYDKFSYLLPHARHMPAFKLGRWDGKVSYFSIGGKTYSGLLEDILPILMSEGYEVVLQDKRKPFKADIKTIDRNYLNHKTWPKGHSHEDQPIVLRDYQVEAINEFLQNHASCQEIPTASGKTVVTAALSDIVNQNVENARTLVIVPNKSLVTQTEEDYVNLDLDVGVYYGDRKDLDKTHTICTWQSLEVIQKNHKSGKSKMSIEDFIDGVKAVIVDEVHSSKAKVLKDLLTGPFKNIPIRWGLTGTIPLEDHNAMALKTAIGPTVGRLSAKTLQDDGVLSNCQVHVLQLQDSIIYNNYQTELAYLTTDSKRLDYLADSIIDISKSGNTLVLVDRIKSGNGLLERLPDDRAVFVSGGMKNAERKDHYDEVSVTDDKIIIATSAVAAIGINMVRLHNLILLESGKSFIKVIQSIGRGLRKGHDKDFVNIYDICSSAKFSKRHLTERKKFYKKCQYPFKVVKIDWQS